MRKAAWPPGYSQPLADLSSYQDLSPHIPIPCSLQESPSVFLPPSLFPLVELVVGFCCRTVKPLCWATPSLAYFLQPLRLPWFLTLVSSGLLKPWGLLSPYILGNAQSETCIESTLMVYRALAHLPRTLATYTNNTYTNIHICICIIRLIFKH